MGQVGEVKREHTRARVYNLAAVRDANFIIIRVLTEQILSKDVYERSPNSRRGLITDSSTSLLSLTSDEMRILNSDPMRNSNDLFEQVLMEEASKL